MPKWRKELKCLKTTSLTDVTGKNFVLETG